MRSGTKILDYLRYALQVAIIKPLYVIFIPWQAVYRPIKALLDAPDKDQKDRLAHIWMERKLNELTFVGVTGAIFVAAITTAFSWQHASSASKVTTATWYSSILLNAVAISISTQQAITLHRLSCYPSSAARIRSMLGQVSASSNTTVIRPKYGQVYLWQTAVMLLNFGILLFVVGFGYFIYQSLCPAGACKAEDKWTLTFIGAFACFGGFTYISSMAILYNETAKHAGKDNYNSL